MYNKKIDILGVCNANKSVNIDNTKKMSESELIFINYPQSHISTKEFITNKDSSLFTYGEPAEYDSCSNYKSHVVSCSESYIDNLITDKQQYEVITDEPLARKRTYATNDNPISKSSSYQDLSTLDFDDIDDIEEIKDIEDIEDIEDVEDIEGIKVPTKLKEIKKIEYIKVLDDLDDWDDKEIMDDYILNSEYFDSAALSIIQDKIYKNFYEKLEMKESDKSSNYDNECFCHYCKKYLVLPQYEILNFLNSHFTFNKNSKYLILVFRLCPDIFLDHDIFKNKYLKKYIMDYLGVNIVSESTEFFKDVIINQYFSKISNSCNSHVYETLFHQPNLKYIDYVKCDSCKNYMCPKHTYLSNCYFAKCKCCDTKGWSICGWCKPGFNEEIACKYLHRMVEH